MGGAENAVEVQNLTKKFNIHHTSGSIKRALLNIARPAEIERFTALENISFNVPHGQTVAVIGRNGSGKSTLLSLLARVYLPTTGSIKLFGLNGGKARVAPLLELGAGFHPDLNGLDNIGFYAALLGMTKREIEARLNDIVEFSELGSKVDTLIRNWNDGAKLRLGFAIAIHIDPDILLVDEVLAVGDEPFRAKCYQRIEQMQRQGKSIIFVSHELQAVKRIANRVIWISKGEVRMDGPVEEVLAAYRADAGGAAQ